LNTRDNVYIREALFRSTVVWPRITYHEHRHFYNILATSRRGNPDRPSVCPP